MNGGHCSLVPHRHSCSCAAGAECADDLLRVLRPVLPDVLLQQHCRLDLRGAPAASNSSAGSSCSAHNFCTETTCCCCCCEGPSKHLAQQWTMRLTVVVAAYAWQSTAALPFGTIVIIMLIWSAITIPLTVFGGIAGKNHQVLLRPAAVHLIHATSYCMLSRCLDWQPALKAQWQEEPPCNQLACGHVVCQYALLQGDFAAPVRTNKYPREIPELPWYRTAVPQMLMAGAHAVSPAYGRIRACAL